MTINTLLVTAFLVFALFLFALFFFGAIYLIWISPTAQRRMHLHRRAAHDYDNARGTQHLKLLRHALDANLQKHRLCQVELDAVRKDKNKVEAKTMGEWQHALIEHLLKTRLQEIRGIGPALSGILYAYAHGQGNLTSLRLASKNIQGIGPSRQADIDAWVARYEAAIPTLVANDFPGKQEIQARYTGHITALSAKIDRLETKKKTVLAEIERIRAAIATLNKVNKHSFLQTLQGTHKMPDEVEQYLRGAFPEWEPVPDWFANLIKEVAA